MNSKRISVIINTYNRLHTLPLTIASIRAQRYKNFEIVIVCGPCTDGTQNWLIRYAADCKIGYVTEANLSVSRNEGIRMSSGDIVCFIDDDAIAEPNWLDEIAAAFDDDSIVAAGGYIRDHTGVSYQATNIRSDRFGESILFDSSPSQWEPGLFSFTGLMGVNSAFRRSALVEIGGFDEEYAYYLDETDVLVRLMDAGGKIAIRPLAEVHHKYAPSHLRNSSSIPKQGSYRIILRSIAYFIIKSNIYTKPISEITSAIEMKRKKFLLHIKMLSSTSKIDDKLATLLKNEIELGINEGIKDAFSHASRKIRKSFLPPPEFMPIHKTIPAKKSLRLCLVTKEYPPIVCGGIGVFMHRLAEKLASMGHEITVITASRTGMHTVDFENGVWVHRIPPKIKNADFSLPLPDMPSQLRDYSCAVNAEIDRIMPIRKIQMVIGTIWDLDIAAVIAAKKIPVAMYLVTSYKLILSSKPDWSKNKNFYRRHVLPMIEAERWALQNADYILASTKAIAQDVHSNYGVDFSSKLSIIPFGIPSAKLDRSTKTTDKINILFVGRLEARKGIDVLLQILPDILQKNRDVTVTIIGRDVGTYRSDFLKEHAGKIWLTRVLFKGEVDDDELQSAYAECDIFVAPSRYESFGLIYLEAMRYAKPCIGTSVGGIREVIVDNETGLLVPPNDPKSLKTAIERLISDKNLRNKLGNNGLNRFKQMFTIDAYAGRIEEFCFGASASQELRTAIVDN